MKYFIQRELNEYGPYTLADLQRYVAQGNIQLTDLTRSEGMTEWVAVSQVIGNIPAPGVPPMPQPPSAQSAQPNVQQMAAQPVAPAAGTVYSGGTTYSGTGTVYEGAPAASVYGGHTLSGQMSALVPPDFHWALVLLIGFFCGLFHVIWIFIEAGFVKKIDPESKAIPYMIGALIAPFVGFFIFTAASSGYNPQRDGIPAGIFPLIFLVVVSVVLQLMAVFQMRSSIERYYNTVEPINLRLSGIMTFFFAVYYFQYHFTRIANWKRTGYIQPQ